MNDLQKYQSLNTIEDDRWQQFEASARKRRLWAIAITVMGAGLGYVLQTVWAFIAVEAGLWLWLKYGRSLKK